MNNLAEDRIRAATRAAAETVRSVHPLELPAPGSEARRARRFLPWTAPVTAAAAVIALAISLVLVRDVPNGPVVPAAKPAPSDAVPARYVALSGPRSGGALSQAVVRDTFTGAAVTSVSAPARDTWLGVAAAADDRTFVLAAAPVAKPPFPATNNGPAAWYELRLRGPGTATLSKLPIPATPGSSYLEGLALSPDGTRLAVLVYQVSGKSEAAVLRVYSVATGAVLHTWSTTKMFTWFQQSGVSWLADGNRLAFSYWWRSGLSAFVGVRTVRVTGSGSDLIADSRLAWSAPLPYQHKAFPFGCSASGHLPVLTMDGTAVVCSAATGAALFEQPGKDKKLCPAVPPATKLGFLRVPAGTRQPAQALYRDDSSCVPDGIVPVETLWTSPSGHAVIGFLAYGEPPATAGSILRFGVFSHGTFRPLPVPPRLQASVTYTPYTVAW